MSLIGNGRLLSAATTTGAGTPSTQNKRFQTTSTVQAWGTTTAGAGAATILVQVSNDLAAPWITAGTITLTLSTTAATDGLSIGAPWNYVRVNVSSLSGTGASISAAIGG